MSRPAALRRKKEIPKWDENGGSLLYGCKGNPFGLINVPSELWKRARKQDFVVLGLDVWVAVQVMVRAEKRIAALLEQRGYQLFVPTYQAVRRWSDRKKTVDLALFPGYVFCRRVEAVSGPVLSTPGVLRIVSFGGQPAPISDEEIENVQRVVASGARSIPWTYLQVGQRVQIVNGLLAGMCGILVRLKNQNRVVISVEAIMKSIAVDADAAEVVPLSKTNPSQYCRQGCHAPNRLEPESSNSQS